MIDLIVVILALVLATVWLVTIFAFVALALAGRRRWHGRMEAAMAGRRRWHGRMEAARRAAREQWRAEVEPRRGCWVRLKVARARERAALKGMQ